MSLLIDSSLWVDYFRARTPVRIKEQIIAFVDSSDSVLCEPIRFEILRAALPQERAGIESVFATIPLLQTPTDLWERSATLGQKCVDARFRPPAIDLLIAQMALHYQAELVTFDSDFADIAGVVSLKVQLLKRSA